MLFRVERFGPESKKLETEFLDQFKVPFHDRGWFTPRFDMLPNKERVTENDFWWSQMGNHHKAEIYCGREVNKIEIDGINDWRDLIVFWEDRDYLQGGGFAVLWCYNQKTTHYFRWRHCVHTFNQRTIGNCHTRYTCSKCGAEHDIDSSG